MLKKLINFSTLSKLVFVLLILSGFWIFWIGEDYSFFKYAIGILLIYSIWRSVKKDSAPLLFTSAFILATDLFKWTTDSVGYPTAIATLAIFIIFMFFFSFRHSSTVHHHFIQRLFSVYSSLLALIMGELFYILTYFNIETKNKAILIVLWFWFFDEIVEALEEDNLSPRVWKAIGTIFIILFVAISITMSFSNSL